MLSGDSWVFDYIFRRGFAIVQSLFCHTLPVFCNTSCLGKKSTAGCGVPIRLVLIPCRARRQACNKRSFSILGSLGVRKRKFWTGPCNPTATGRLTSDTEVSNQVTKASPKTLQSPKTLLTPMTTNSTFKLEANRPALQKKELAQSVSR